MNATLKSTEPRNGHILRRASLFLDYAEFCGMQDDGNGGSFVLFNLRKDIPGHPKGSTVTRETVWRGLRQLHGV